MLKQVDVSRFENISRSSLCSFKLVGVKDYQSNISKLKPFGNGIKLIHARDRVYGLNYENNDMLGKVTDYFASILAPVIDQEEDQCLYAVTDIKGYKKRNGYLKGVRAILEPTDNLPECLSTRSGLRIWHCTIKGVTFGSCPQSLRDSVDELAGTGVYPSITLRREPNNSYDTNAIIIFGYVKGKWQPLGYLDKWDAKDICENSENGYRFYSRLVDLGIVKDSGVCYGKYEIVGVQCGIASSDFSELV